MREFKVGSKVKVVKWRGKDRARLQYRSKHPNDQNHGKSGWVGGNPRYQRTRATEGKNRTMKGLGSR